jgi:hypothetical protein
VKNYRISAPPRIAAVGFGPGRGGSPPYAGSPWTVPGSVGGPSSSGNPRSDAIASFQASALSSAQIALGALLVGTALLIVLSQTSAGSAAGAVGKGAARRGLRAIPGVGILA